MVSTLVRAEYRIDVDVKRLLSGDRDFEKAFRKVNDKAQVNASLKRCSIALNPINKYAAAAHVFFNNAIQMNASLVPVNKEEEFVQVWKDMIPFALRYITSSRRTFENTQGVVDNPKGVH